MDCYYETASSGKQSEIPHANSWRQMSGNASSILAFPKLPTYTAPCNCSINIIYSSFHHWLYSPFLGPGRFFSFVILYTADRSPCTRDQPLARPLPTHKTAQPQNKRIKTETPRMRFESTILALEWENTVRAPDRAATMTGTVSYQQAQVAETTTTELLSMCTEQRT
jgi:hypothetical protein